MNAGQTVKTAPRLFAGKYAIERQLGEGGMGEVHLAVHTAMGNRVAIKTLRKETLADETSVERFNREARAAVSLRSEHVARVLDVGVSAEGEPYMVMEYLEGQDLAAMLRTRGPLPVHEAVDYVLQACEAIAEAHGLGIVHRDLKPANLFVTRRVDGAPLVKVLDFGISKLAAEAQQGQAGALTRTSTIMGSPSYMSPEQLRSSRDVDPRGDIWALGVILYELLTGRVPFLAETLTELTIKVVSDPAPSIASVRPDVPPHLAQVVDHCLQKQREARFPSVGALAAELERYVTTDQDSVARRIARMSAPAPHPSSSPSAPGSQQRLGGGHTNISWGETSIATNPGDPPVIPVVRSGPPVLAIVGALVALLAVGGAGTIGFLLYRDQGKPGPTQPIASASAVTSAALPDDRTQLPPSLSATAATSSSAPIPSSLPSGRQLPAASTTAAGGQTTRKPPPGTKPSAAPKPVETGMPDERK